MNTFIASLLGERRRLVVCLVLVCASVACASLVGARVLGTGRFHFLFLIWNLFLAWVPFGASLLAYELHKRREAGLPVLLGIGLFWLLFFPNAPYIISDLVHLKFHGGNTQHFSFWYDLVMISCFAWTGLLLGFVSLYLMQTIVRERFGGRLSWFFTASMLFAGGFGVYLGRFQRWNSWDLVHRPFALLSDVLNQIMHPLAHKTTWGITLLFAGMLLMLYVVLYSLLQYAKSEKEAGPVQNNHYQISSR